MSFIMCCPLVTERDSYGGCCWYVALVSSESIARESERARHAAEAGMDEDVAEEDMVPEIMPVRLSTLLSTYSM